MCNEYFKNAAGNTAVSFALFLPVIWRGYNTLKYLINFSMNKFAATILMVLFFILSHSQQAEKGVPATLAADRAARITHLQYQLSFNIPKMKSESITGAVSILFDLHDIKKTLLLDFRQDSSHVSSVTVNGYAVKTVVQDEHILIPADHLVAEKNKVNIAFIAGNESLNRNTDYLYALFVPDRARTVFPCFDQPDLKANFLLTLTVPSDWNVLANASIKDSAMEGGKTIYHFALSDLLPTYLFSFTAGKYAVADKDGMRFLYRETDTAKIKWSVDAVFRAHRDAIAFLEKWTGIPYPFQKIGFVAIPAFQFGGMEHPGEVQYNAPGLFLDAGATKDQIIARSNVISHETAHMWFGDMVTMKWFNDVWMKEVFANFMADKVTEKLMGNETFNQKFLLDHIPAAYNVDRTKGANPIRQQLDNLQDAGSLYGNIIYHKAPVVMRQLERLMGADAFQLGVREYLERYKYGNARWNDLIDILSKHTKENLTQWNQVWVNETGRPVFSYTIKDKQLIIAQKPEYGSHKLWPEHFAVRIFYENSTELLQVDSKDSITRIPVQSKPKGVLLNADGTGYGLFPAFNGNSNQLANPVERASAYINAYENMLAGQHITPEVLYNQLLTAIKKESNELNLRLICGYMSTVYWNFTSPARRLERNAILEPVLWNSMQAQTTANNKKILFNTYRDIVLSKEGVQQLYGIWQTQKAPDSVKLTEDDYIALALAISVKSDTSSTIVQDQIARISNPDRKARLQFLLPAVSADSAIRDAFFNSLHNIDNRRKEAWVIAGLSYLNHPLRQHAFEKFLPETLNMLQEVQQTGDVFFPQNWLSAVFSNYQSPAAWKVVETFLSNHPRYNPKLKAKILQATDLLYRAKESAATPTSKK